MARTLTPARVAGDFAGPQPDHTLDDQAPYGEGGKLTETEAQRLSELLALPNPSDADKAEIAALQAKESAASTPPLLPLTPAEVGRLAELRAMPTLDEAQYAEQAKLIERENVPQPVVVLPPDPERVAPLTLSVMGGLVALLERLPDVVPMAHSLSRSIATIRTQFDQLVFHSTPPADQPPK